MYAMYLIYNYDNLLGKGVPLLIMAISNVTKYFNDLVYHVRVLYLYIFSFIETSPKLDDDEEYFQFGYDGDDCVDV